MHVTIEINGRQALPVRAIPLLTDWHGLSPDGLAQILAGDSDHWPSLDGLTAHRLHSDGSIEAIPPRWWASWVVRELDACSDRIKAAQGSHEVGYQQWRQASLPLLPAGVFVWRDEFEAAHAKEYGPQGLRARGNPEGFDPRGHALDFNPNPNPMIARMPVVMEGFEQVAGDIKTMLPQIMEWMAGPMKKATEQDEVAWFDVTLDAAGFFALEHVPPVQAAMLLCQISPHDSTESEAETCTTDCTSPDDFKRLRLTFVGIDQSRPARRSLLDWMAIAAGAGRAVHPWAQRYAKLRGLCKPSESTPAEPTLSVQTAPAMADSASDAPAWTVNKPKRYNGYAAPLHRLLAAAYRDDKPCPTARDVVEAWRNNAPAEIAKVLPDGFDYYDAKGDTKTANLEAIRKAIGRMTIAR